MDHAFNSSMAKNSRPFTISREFVYIHAGHSVLSYILSVLAVGLIFSAQHSIVFVLEKCCGENVCFDVAVAAPCSIAPIGGHPRFNKMMIAPSNRRERDDKISFVLRIYVRKFRCRGSRPLSLNFRCIRTNTPLDSFSL